MLAIYGLPFTVTIGLEEIGTTDGAIVIGALDLIIEAVGVIIGVIVWQLVLALKVVVVIVVVA